MGIHPTKLKAGFQRDICTPVFIAASFTIAKRWKQPRYLLMGEWINDVWSVHTIKYHSALKGRKLTHATTWKNLKDTMLGEISQSQKDKYYMILLRTSDPQRQKVDSILHLS